MYILVVRLGFGGGEFFFFALFMVLGVSMRIELAQVLFITTNRIPNQVFQISPSTMTSTHGQSSFSQLSDFPSVHAAQLI